MAGTWLKYNVDDQYMSVYFCIKLCTYKFHFDSILNFLMFIC